MVIRIVAYKDSVSIPSLVGGWYWDDMRPADLVDLVSWAIGEGEDSVWVENGDGELTLPTGTFPLRAWVMEQLQWLHWSTVMMGPPDPDDVEDIRRVWDLLGAFPGRPMPGPQPDRVV